MKASICIAAHDKPDYLRRTLESIYRQQVVWDASQVEVIVADDRSPDDEICRVCAAYPVKYLRLDGGRGYCNPSRARNATYRAARGEIIIAQSDDTLQIAENCIERLVEELRPRHFLIASVFNADFDGNRVPSNLENPTYPPLINYTGPLNPRPFFFLGSLWRKDLYAVGGNDEEFVAPGREDQWFADCLMHGLRLKPVFSPDIVGHHLQHQHLGVRANSMPSRRVYREKHRSASEGKSPWCSSGGPWTYT